MVFEGSEVGAATDLSIDLPEQQTEKLEPEAELQAGRRPADSISICNNPFFDDSGDYQST